MDTTTAPIPIDENIETTTATPSDNIETTTAAPSDNNECKKNKKTNLMVLIPFLIIFAGFGMACLGSEETIGLGIFFGFIAFWLLIGIIIVASRRC